MSAFAELDVWDCIEIADACVAAGKAELIPQMLREGCAPKETRRRLAILTNAEPEPLPKQNMPQMVAHPDAALEAATLAWFRR